MHATLYSKKQTKANCMPYTFHINKLQYEQLFIVNMWISNWEQLEYVNIFRQVNISNAKITRLPVYRCIMMAKVKAKLLPARSTLSLPLNLSELTLSKFNTYVNHILLLFDLIPLKRKTGMEYQVSLNNLTKWQSIFTAALDPTSIILKLGKLMLQSNYCLQRFGVVTTSIRVSAASLVEISTNAF